MPGRSHIKQARVKNNRFGSMNWTRVSPRRALILSGIGALLGLVVAGFGLFTSKGTRTFVVPPEDVAIVNNVPILTSDYDALLMATYNVSPAGASPEQRKTIIDAMINEELYVQRGIELGMQTDVIEVRQALVSAVEAQQTADIIAAPFNDEELKAFYQNHSNMYATEGKIQGRDYVAPDVAQAQLFLAQLNSTGNESAASKAAAMRQTGLFSDGPEFYFAAKLHMEPALFSVAQTLKPGMASRPVELSDGVHVLVMVMNDPPHLMPFDTVKDKVLRDMREKKSQIVRASSGAFLRRRADIIVTRGLE